MLFFIYFLIFNSSEIIRLNFKIIYFLGCIYKIKSLKKYWIFFEIQLFSNHTMKHYTNIQYTYVQCTVIFLFLVQFRVNLGFPELLSELGSGLIGIHTMWNEHFGIGIVEMMAAGLLTIAHRFNFCLTLKWQ